MTTNPDVHQTNISFYERRSGKCRKVVDGKRCNAEFEGPRTRKYCDQHRSASIKLRGK